MEFSELGERTAIIGPPGTGKTYQIEKLIKHSKGNFLYLTYSRSMAQDARKRIGDDYEHIGTFHSILAKHLGMASFLQKDDVELFCKRYGLTSPRFFNDEETMGSDDFSNFMQKYDYARNTMQPIGNDSRLNLKFIAREYEKFKRNIGKYDYTDILVRASETDLPPYFSLFVDEAQDLTPLMWKIVDNWVVGKLVLGGDDDQCIFSFKGAFAKDFIKHAKSSDIIELTTSKRFGDNVRKMAQKVTKNIHQIEKHYIGVGQTEMKFLNILQFIKLPGEKTILTRTNKLAQNIASYLPVPTWPINPTHSLGNGWTNRTLHLTRILNEWPPNNPDDIKYLIQHLPASIMVRGVKKNIETLQPNLYGFEGLFKHKPSPRNVIDYLNVTDRQKSLLRNYLGRKVNEIVRIDTIHSAKGMEFDNVLFVMDKPYDLEYNDDEKRIVYTGITRVKKLLAFAYTDFYRDQYRLY